MKKLKGFSLVEILIALVLITVSLLGLQVMQARSAGYLIENNKYNMAVELSNEFIDLVRTYKYLIYTETVPNNLYYHKVTQSNSFWNNGKIKLGGSCSIGSDFSTKLGCWNIKANNLGITNSIQVLDGRDIVVVTLFWDSVSNSNGDYKCYSEASGSDKCSYSVRVEI